MGADINTFEMNVSNISSVSSFKYLFLCPLVCSWYNVVVFMFNNRTQQTYTFLVSATENLEELLMFLADHLLQSSSGFSQIVSLFFKQTLMLFEVILTVRVQTHQTGLDSFVFSSSTDVTLHISSSSVTVRESLVFFSFSTTSASMVFLAKAGLGLKVCLHWGQL